MIKKDYQSVKRIEEFLDEYETQKYTTLQKNEENEGVVGFENANFEWFSSDQEGTENFRLDVGNLIFPNGKLSLVVGPVGSGKTSLLMALLGEMNCLNGRVFLPSPPMREQSEPGILTDTVAYCSQNAWLLSMTIRENILFGNKLDKERYEAVVNACALAEDFKLLDLEDLSEVGERGIALSGGQKARIA